MRINATTAILALLLAFVPTPATESAPCEADPRPGHVFCLNADIAGERAFVTVRPPLPDCGPADLKPPCLIRYADGSIGLMDADGIETVARAAR